MADINSNRTSHTNAAAGAAAPQSSGTGPASTTSASDQLSTVAIIELFFFAYRDFTSDPDQILESYGFGRAHHRVLHFVDRYPGMRVAELLDVLKITKQSLARVLRQLVEQGYIEQRAGEADRRERRLYATVTGRALISDLIRPQIARVSSAIAALGPDGSDAIEAFLFAMISAEDRAGARTLLQRAVSTPDRTGPRS